MKWNVSSIQVPIPNLCVSGSASPTKYPCQVLSVAEHILFTERCEEALKGGDLNGYLLELEGQLDSYTSTDISPTGPDDRLVLQ